MSTGILVSTVAAFATRGANYPIHAALGYQPFVDDNTFQLFTGENLEGPYWTLPLPLLQRALANPDVTVEENNLTITASELGVVMMVPLNGEFAVITFDVRQICEFTLAVTSTPFALWEDGRFVTGVIDMGEMPLVA